jgi:hypothetical protein
MKTRLRTLIPRGLEPGTPAELSVENRPAGFHVRPVPIDQPFREALDLFVANGDGRKSKPALYPAEHP